MKAWMLLASLAILTADRPASADDKAACLDAADQGQQLRSAHKLIEARDRFRVCAAAGCPAVVQSDCAAWLDAVEKDLPTVVLIAKNVAGGTMVDVRVSVDGKPLQSRLEGEAVPLNPGSHTFHFEAASGVTHDEQAVVPEGGKNQLVTVVMGAPQGAPSAEHGTAPATTGPQSVAASDPGGSSSSLRTWGWIVGGTGVAGLAVGTIFGLVAMGDKNGANCVNDVCNQGTTGPIKSNALISDVGWIAGGLLTAGGISLLLLSPSGRADHAGWMRVAPLVASHGGGVGVDGSW